MGVKVSDAKYGKWRNAVIIGVAVLAVIFIIMGIIMKDSLGVDINEDITVAIAQGEGSSQAADKLYEAGAIKYPAVIKAQAYLSGTSKDVQPGKITIKRGMSYTDILNMMIQNGRSNISVTVKPGSTASEIASELCEKGLAEWNKFYDELKPENFDYKFLEKIPEREVKLEGYLYPATYDIPLGMSEHDIIDLMLKAFDSQFKEEYYQRATELGMSVDQIVTMASIVERETGADSEKKKVAGVFYNKRNCGMKLQSAASLQYVIGERKTTVTNDEAATESPYNTFKNNDLPIGPISNPGIASIEAALYPESSDAYYFALTKDGQHIYAANYNDFISSVKGTQLMINVDDAIIENQDDRIGQTAELKWNG